VASGIIWKKSLSNIKVTLFVYDYCICPDTGNRGFSTIFNRKDKRSRSSKNRKDVVLYSFVNDIDCIAYNEYSFNMSRFILFPGHSCFFEVIGILNTCFWSEIKYLETLWSIEEIVFPEIEVLTKGTK